MDQPDTEWSIETLVREASVGSTASVTVSPMRTTQQRLRELVQARDPGARIPSERDLAASWGVARMTLRRAVDVLVTEGLLERRHGSGTYVLPRPCVRLLGLTSFTTDMRERGMVPSSRLLAFSRGPAGETLAHGLQVPVGTEIVSFSRLRLADDLPMAVETVWLPRRLVPGLTGADLDRSFYALLAQRYRTAPQSADVSIEPAVPSGRLREHLGLAGGEPCLRITVTSRDARTRVFMLSVGHYRSDRYQLRAEILAGAFAAHGRVG